MIAAAPAIADFYGDDAAAHFDAVRAGLDDLGIPFTVDPRLVRGLDYYRRTTFEFAGRHARLGPERRSAAAAATTASSRRSAARRRPASASRSASTARCSPATTRACSPRRDRAVDVFVVDTTGGREALRLTDELRARRASRRPRLREPQHEGPDEGGRPQRRRRRRHRRRRRAWPPAPSSCARCATATAASRPSCPATTCSTHLDAALSAQRAALELMDAHAYACAPTCAASSRAEHIGQTVRAVRLGRPPPRARRAPRLRRRPRPHRRHPVRRRQRRRRAQRVRRARHRRRAAPARRARSTRTCRPARSRSATARSRC